MTLESSDILNRFKVALWIIYRISRAGRNDNNIGEWETFSMAHMGI
jgi:hypothetical protein